MFSIFYSSSITSFNHILSNSDLLTSSFTGSSATNSSGSSAIYTWKGSLGFYWWIWVGFLVGITAFCSSSFYYPIRSKFASACLWFLNPLFNLKGSIWSFLNILMSANGISGWWWEYFLPWIDSSMLLLAFYWINPFIEAGGVPVR